MIKKYLYLSPIVAIVIIYFSVIKSLPEPLQVAPEHEFVLKEATPITMNLSETRDMVGHALMYTLFSLAIFIDLTWRGILKKKAYIACIVVPIIFGGAMELIQQYFFPPRSAEWIDFFSDSFGVLIALLLIRMRKSIKIG